MDKRKKTLSNISLVIFFVGTLLGLLIASGIIWSDFEASLFDTGMRANSTLRGLKCPVVISTHEVGKISVTLKNPTEREKTFFVRSHIAEGHVLLKRELDQHIPVEPNGKELVEWEVYPEDAAYSRFVFFRVFVASSFPLPSKGNFCGVMVIDIPGLTGGQIFFLLLGLSLTATIGGNLMWRKICHPLSQKTISISNAMAAFMVALFGAILVGYLGVWIFGAIFLTVSVLMTGIFLGLIFLPSTRLP